MVPIWSDSEDDSMEEKNENKVINICFMTIDELDEVNSNLNYEDLQDAFEELYEDHEKVSSKNVSLKKILCLEKEYKDM